MGCDELNCANGGLCEANIGGDAVCHCLSGFMGKTCEQGMYQDFINHFPIFIAEKVIECS